MADKEYPVRLSIDEMRYIYDLAWDDWVTQKDTGGKTIAYKMKVAARLIVDEETPYGWVID